MDSDYDESPPPALTDLSTEVDVQAEDSAPRRIYRARDGRIFAGVCMGTARHLGLDPTLLRAVTALLCFVGGAGFIAYLAAMFLIPVEPARSEEDQDADRVAIDVDWLAIWGGFALITIGAFIASRIDFLHYSMLSLSPAAWWPLLMAGLGLGIAIHRRGNVHEAGLTRPCRDRFFLGVASGFARYVDIDVNLVRIALTILALWSRGLAALLYVVLGMFLPEES